MKKNTRIKTKTAVADPRKVRAILLDAASSVEVRSDKADDARLLKAARAAQHHGDGFTEMFNTVTTVNGAVEVLFQMIHPRGDVPEEVNWTVVADLLDDCRRRLGAVYCGLAELHQYERNEGEAADGN
jgi:hypothetical protein